MFFADTYALLEIVYGNRKYKDYLSEKIITTRLNLMELYYALLRDHNEEKAEYYYNFFVSFCIAIDDSTIKKAMQFKLEHRKLGLSYMDCIGYVLASDKGIRFLTGDKAFKGLKNVEFVK